MKSKQIAPAAIVALKEALTNMALLRFEWSQNSKKDDKSQY